MIEKGPTSSNAPTERQLEYAKDLGVAVPADATKGQVSELIQAKIDEKDAAKLPDVLIEEVDLGAPTRSGCMSVVALVVLLIVFALLW